MEKNKKLGLLGGTFNPIHFGHLRLAETAQKQYELDQILFIPNHIPPHRDSGSEFFTDPEKRYCMAVLSTLPYQNFYVSDIELKRPGTSYTYDTVVELQKTFPSHELHLIAGVDTLMHYKWHRFDELCDLLNGILLTARSAEAYKQVIEKLQKSSARVLSKLREISMPPVEISATEIRKKIGLGQSITHLVPESVQTYIERYQLYREVSVK